MEELRLEEATGETLGGAALALEKCYGKGVSQGGAAVSFLESQRKGGLGDRCRGSAQDELLLPAAPLVASFRGPLRA